MIDDENKNQQGITAYHGSPHEFDEFDTAKIGAGEGAQSYGHGLYFAESEPVAKGYRDRLSSVSPKALEQYFKPGEIIAGYGGKDKVLDYDPQSRVVKVQGIDSRGELEPHVRTHQTMPDLNKVNAAFKERGLDPHIPGYMYEVAIDAHPDHFLDWNKPLSEQSFHIGKSIFDARKDNPTLFNVFKPHLEKDSTGMGFYQSLATQHPNGYQGATDFLQRAGIPGIKYLDAGSRSAGEGSSNYVVFDHNRVKVKRRYEQGGKVVRTKRATGGRIPHADKLFKEAKKTLDNQTKPMLNVHDDAIVQALRIAQGRV
jgi:hypothetical protein